MNIADRAAWLRRAGPFCFILFNFVQLGCGRRWPECYPRELSKHLRDQRELRKDRPLEVLSARVPLPATLATSPKERKISYSSMCRINRGRSR